MPRERHDAIPADEHLFRSISSDDVLGGDVLPQAVDLPRCSFNRSAYSEATAVFRASRPHDNGVAVLVAGDLPAPVPRATAVPYEFVVVDDPNPAEDPDNDAHCEVRLKPQGLPFNKNRKPSKEILAKAKEALASKLAVHVPPT